MLDSLSLELRGMGNVSVRNSLQQVSAPTDHHGDKAALQAKANLRGKLLVECLNGRLDDFLRNDLAIGVVLLLHLGTDLDIAVVCNVGYSTCDVYSVLRVLDTSNVVDKPPE